MFTHYILHIFHGTSNEKKNRADDKRKRPLNCTQKDRKVLKTIYNFTYIYMHKHKHTQLGFDSGKLANKELENIHIRFPLRDSSFIYFTEITGFVNL